VTTQSVEVSTPLALRVPAPAADPAILPERAARVATDSEVRRRGHRDASVDVRPSLAEGIDSRAPDRAVLEEGALVVDAELVARHVFQLEAMRRDAVARAPRCSPTGHGAAPMNRADLVEPPGEAHDVLHAGDLEGLVRAFEGRGLAQDPEGVLPLATDAAVLEGGTHEAVTDVEVDDVVEPSDRGEPGEHGRAPRGLGPAAGAPNEAADGLTGRAPRDEEAT